MVPHGGIFEVGKSYKITMLVYHSDGRADRDPRPACRVVTIDGPLLKLDLQGKEWILNTHSPFFVEAELG
jgi:hypothetical protein